MTATEFSIAGTANLSGYRNTTDLLLRRLATAGQHAAFEVERPDGSWTPVTTAEFHRHVVRVAKGLIGSGVKPGESVAIMAATRYEWTVCDLACWFAGAVVVPIYETAAPAQVAAVLADADVRAGLAGGSAQAELLRSKLAAAKTHGVWVMDAGPDDLEALAALGAGVSDTTLEDRRASRGVADVATIVYTSGTTAAPKGAEITHANFLHQVLNVAAAYSEVVRSDGNTVIFLPLAHVLARGLQLVCLANGMRIAHLSEPGRVVAALPVLRPTFLVVVPRVLQKVRAAAAAKAELRHLGAVWRAAQDTAIAWGRHLEACQDSPGNPAPLALRWRHAVFDRLFYRRLRGVLGGRIDYLLSGAAALDADLCRFFLGAGLPVLEGYGLTETTAPVTGNRPGSIRAGSVGTPLPGTTIRISPEGEVLAKGGGVFSGYHRHGSGLDEDGFLHTGDLGHLDPNGRLHLSGRLKDVIVTSGGKTVSPTAWESQVELDPLVAHAVLVGEGKPYLGGLILLDAESVTAWAEREGATGLTRLQLPSGDELTEITDSRLLAAVGRAVQAANDQLSRAEQARRFSLLLANLNSADGLLTPTQKLRRPILLERATQFIEKLYRED